MRCQGCKRLEAGENLVKLHNGETVCNYCPTYAQECLARELLKTPLRERRKRLDLFSGSMTPNAIQSLKETLTTLHGAYKAKPI